MFGIFGKSIDLHNIKNIKDVQKIVHYFIKNKKWDLGFSLIKNAKIFESENKRINLIKYEGNKSKQEKIQKNYSTNIETLKELTIKLEKEQTKYNVQPDTIRSFNDVIKAIKIYIQVSEWEKAYHLIEEIRIIEYSAFRKLYDEISIDSNNSFSEKEKTKQKKLHQLKTKKLDKILFQTKKQERDYNKKKNAARFKIHFKNIKSEINILSKSGHSPQALNLLKRFLEENKENSIFIHFYNKEKVRIFKKIEAQKKSADKKIKLNIRQQAMALAGRTIKIDDLDKEIEKEKRKGFPLIEFFKKRKNFYKDIKERIKRKKLIDDVTMLIEENEIINKQMTEEKLQSIHKGLSKEITSNEVTGYELYGKILGADKISGDTFGLFNGKLKYTFFLGDATGHGIKAGLIITLFTRLFNTFVAKKSLQELTYEINNGLKQDLKSRNFITGVLFEIEKHSINTLRYSGMGHEPMFVYRRDINKVQKIIPGGLAAGIRIIKDTNSVKIKDLILNDGDILLVYSDGITESRSLEGNKEQYGFARLEKAFFNINQTEKNIQNIYNKIVDDVILFKGGSSFSDDSTILLFKRDKNKDVQDKESSMIKTLSNKQNLTSKEKNTLIGKNADEIKIELNKIKKDRQLKLIVENLKKLYYIGEFLKLKQEAIRYIKSGWVHQDINFYLKKALDNEQKYKIDQKTQRISNRYNILSALMKKGDYSTVIQEIELIISKDGDI